MNGLSISLIAVFALAVCLIYWRHSLKVAKLNLHQAQLSQDLKLYKTSLKSLMGIFNSRSRMLERLKFQLSEKNGKALHEKELKQLQKQFNGADNWQAFLKEYETLEMEWLDQLNQNYSLTINDKKLLIMQRLQLNNSDMQAVMNVSSEGLKKAKSRLKKKLNTAEDFQLIHN